MNENVRRFMEMITTGADVMEAANETGVIEMSTYELLNEVSVFMKVNGDLLNN